MSKGHFIFHVDFSSHIHVCGCVLMQQRWEEMEVSEENLGRLVEMLTGTLSHDPAQRRAGEYCCISLVKVIILMA